MNRKGLPAGLHADKACRQGFTLIELVVLIVIVGIVAVVASVTMKPGDSIRLNIAAKKVASDLQYARSMSLSMAKWYGINFQVSPANIYTVYQTDGTTDTIIGDPAIPGNNFVVHLPGVHSGVAISNVNFGAGTKIEFSPLGVPYTDKAGSPIASAGVITLQSGGYSQNINIAPGTGLITTP